MSEIDIKNIENYIDNLDIIRSIFIWGAIQNCQNYQPNNLDHLKEIIKKWVISSGTQLSNLQSMIEANIIEDHHFDFLDKENKRQIIYFDNWIRSKFTLLIDINLPEIFKDNLYIQTVTNFNSIYQQHGLNKISQDIQLLSMFKYDWNQLVLDKKSISWLDPNNEIQIEWAYQYIQNKKPISFFGLALPQKVGKHVDPMDLYTYVINGVDALSLEAVEKKQLFLNKMRSSWSQKKFREEGKTKKPYHLPLTKEAHKQLEFLSKILNKPTSQVLESMIRDKYQEYSDQKTGKNLY
ncbi:hypothetical protein [Acinetobacter brisouii]|uniref:hypothetical protein n=1 Tax=Acinetobacter brisouii TaxID=396323 RepID=UPI0005F825D2|nr:hypothetical protein [Acinetobacter brisouii]KJV39722.1 hypothetical protein VH98_04360 [Acinetobacter brisouii]